MSEKQKAKYTYGLLEKQFSRTDQASHGRHHGEPEAKLLECRLDNVVTAGYRPDVQLPASSFRTTSV